MVEGGETLMLGGQEIGVVNSPCYSHRMQKSLALAHIKPGAPVGATIQLSSDSVTTDTVVVASPIYDPEKTRTHG